MKRTLILTGLLIQALGVFACGTQPVVSRLQGGTEVGNPPKAYRLIEGMAPAAADWEGDTSIAAPGDCLGSQVWAQRDEVTVVVGSVDYECRFRFWIESGYTYRFYLSLSSDVQIPLVFAGEAGLENDLHVESSELPVTWGQLGLAFSDEQWVAIPHAPPAEVGVPQAQETNYGFVFVEAVMQAENTDDPEDYKEPFDQVDVSELEMQAIIESIEESIEKDGTMMRRDGSVEGSLGDKFGDFEPGSWPLSSCRFH